MKRTPNAFTRLKYIACLEKHICDRAEIRIRRSGILRKGLEVAREQKAKSLELKVCMSIYDLYELRHSAGEYHHSQLGEIYEFFSEGFDTTDLVRARAKLNKPE